MQFPVSRRRRSSRRSSRRSNRPDSWFLVDTVVDTSNFTEARSPQHNDDNISSSQEAAATASPSHPSLHSLAHAGWDDTDTEPIIHYHDAHPSFPSTTATADPTAVHSPPSNGVSSSTETAGTTDTAIFHGHGRPVPPTTTTPYTDTPSLTEGNMHRLQREITQFHSASIAGWADNAGMGVRLVGRHLASAAAATAATGGSSIAGGGRGGDGASAEWHFVLASMPEPDDVLSGSGAWACREGRGYTGGRLGW